MNPAYAQEARNLEAAIDVAIWAFQQYPPPSFSDTHIATAVEVYAGFRQEISSPTSHIRTTRYLAQIQAEVFTYFQETAGPTVDQFWLRISELRLPYRRIRPIDSILRRRKIRTRAEYDYVNDLVVGAEQNGDIDPQTGKQLRAWLGEFESRRRT